MGCLSEEESKILSKEVFLTILEFFSITLWEDEVLLETFGFLWEVLSEEDEVGNKGS